MRANEGLLRQVLPGRQAQQWWFLNEKQRAISKIIFSRCFLDFLKQVTRRKR